MNDSIDQQILTEIRKIRRNQQATSVACITAVFTILVFYGWFRMHTYSSLHQSPQPPIDSWDTVRAAMDHFEYDKAAGIAQSIVGKNPNDYYGYAYLGNIALATGRIKEAEGYYVHADNLLPCEEYDKMLEAIRKRLARENSVQAPESK